MASDSEIRLLVKEINDLVESDSVLEVDDKFWCDAGAKLIIFIDELVLDSEKVNLWIPKEYSSHKVCLLQSIFHILAHMSDINKPFDRDIAYANPTYRDLQSMNDENYASEKTTSFYELALSRFCSLICQTLGDRFPYLQRLTIKHLFGPSDSCSLFASDVYMFMMRIIDPTKRLVMCQIIMNMCKLAPPEAIVKGAAFINRIKHHTINFENSLYQSILHFD